MTTLFSQSQELDWDTVFKPVKTNPKTNQHQISKQNFYTRIYSGLTHLRHEILDQIVQGKSYLHYKVHENKKCYRIPDSEIRKIKDIYYDKHFLAIVDGRSFNELNGIPEFAQKLTEYKKPNEEPIIRIARIPSEEHRIVGASLLTIPQNSEGEAILGFLVIDENHMKKDFIRRKLLLDVAERLQSRFKDSSISKIRVAIPETLEIDLWTKEEADGQNQWYSLAPN